MTDGYAAWRALDGPTHFGCLAHARCAFVDALKGMKKPGGRAAQALEYFKALYQVETLAKADLPEGETCIDYKYRLRQQHGVPLLVSFRTWLDEQAPQVLPESLLGKAISYTRDQWTYLSRYVCDGRAPADNNVAVQRHRRRREGECHDLQPGAHLPRLQRRTLRLSPACTHRIAATRA
jgi:hypothetical protein